MRSYVATVVAGALLASVLSATGCVSRAEYEQAVAASRRATEQLERYKNVLRELRSETQKLLTDVQDRDKIITARDDEIALVRKAKDDLQKDFDELNRLYEQAIGRSVPTPTGILLPPAVDKALRDFAAANPDLVEYLPNYGMVKLKSDLTFEPGSDFVQPAAKDALAKFVAIVNTDVAAKFHVYIAGHTDDMPIAKPATRRRHPDNWYLSAHRAVAVQQVLAKAGLAPRRLGTMGFSEYHPVEPNAPNNRGNKLNRRVEIWIVPPDRFLTAGEQ